MLVGCIHRIDKCSNACSHFKLHIRQKPHRRCTALTLGAIKREQQLHMAQSGAAYYTCRGLGCLYVWFADGIPLMNMLYNVLYAQPIHVLL